MSNLLDDPKLPSKGEAKIKIPDQPEHVPVKLTYYEIENDNQQVRCGHCGRITNVNNCVYITRDDGGAPTIAERSCLGDMWFLLHEKGEEKVKRTAAKIWRVGKLKLKIVKPKKFKPVTPGEVLLEEFMKPLNISSEFLAAALGVNDALIRGIIKGKLKITETIAKDLGDYFKVSPEIWTGLQQEYDKKVNK